VLNKLVLKTYFRFPNRRLLWGCYWVPGVTLGPFPPFFVFVASFYILEPYRLFFLPADVLEFLLWVVVVYCDLWLSVCVQQVRRKFGFWQIILFQSERNVGAIRSPDFGCDLSSSEFCRIVLRSVWCSSMFLHCVGQCFASDVWLTVHRNSVWIRKTN